MATTRDQAQQEQDEFSATFSGADPVKHEQTEDEAFGIVPEATEPPAEEPAVAESAGQEATEEQPAEEPEADDAASGTAGAAGDDEAGTAPAVAIVVEPAESEEPVMSEKDVQREKSWEGRLKAREAELKAREEALAAREVAPAAEPGEAAEPVAEPAAAEAIEVAAEKVESGELTAEQAMATLTQDFGDEFTKMLGVLIDARASEIAGKTADEKVAGVSKNLDGLVDEIVSDKAKSHFESISDAHPDFLEVAESAEFKQFIDAMSEDEKAQAEQTIERGNARQIVKLIGSYKASLAKPEEDKPVEADPARETAMDAAEGVRSKGLKVPEKPTMSQDYEQAWNDF